MTSTNLKSTPASPAVPHLVSTASAIIGTLVWIVVLGFHNIADGDLWAKLVLGGHFWEQGEILRHDLFAFTPVLPQYIDHEWGAGAVFYILLKWCGPASLQVLKITLACGALGIAVAIARRQHCGWEVLLLLAPFSAAAMLSGYVPVVRSHAFTFFFFAVTLLTLEEIWRGNKKWILVQVPIMGLWANMHGGFVAGLGATLIYTAFALATSREWKPFVALLAASTAASSLNPYGLQFWKYLLPALAHPRPEIPEWLPPPLWGMDAFIGFRVLFLMVLLVVVGGWRCTASKPSLPALAMLALTALLGWQSRRHGPFFAITAMAFAAPFLQGILTRIWRYLNAWLPGLRLQPAMIVLAFHFALACWAAVQVLPGASLQVLAPVGAYPVREADILQRSGVSGNLVTPFEWGSYCTWRLFPRVKVSMDGRYEAAYPESTFRMNQDFHFKRGADWNRLLREYRIDFVILDLSRARLDPAELEARGFVVIWTQPGCSALLASYAHAAQLREAAASLPPTTIDPLDTSILTSWWNVE
ncbi:MAG: hypothetical protein KJ072_08630 [Verrucomicrobia bacterium]|nr:hypothetical protein [Verrucomicrobiota bacterium]